MADGRVQSGEDSIERLKPRQSLSKAFKRRISVQETDCEASVSDRGTGVRESDYKKRQVKHTLFSEDHSFMRLISLYGSD